MGHYRKTHAHSSCNCAVLILAKVAEQGLQWHCCFSLTRTVTVLATNLAEPLALVLELELMLMQTVATYPSLPHRCPLTRPTRLRHTRTDQAVVQAVSAVSAAVAPATAVSITPEVPSAWEWLWAWAQGQWVVWE
jgi:hypothetical protein